MGSASETADRGQGSAKRRGPSFTSLILGGLTLGIAVGLLFGELAAPLKFLGDVYIGLLQMTVLPYIVVSLIANIGGLSLREGRVLAKYGVLVLLALWGIGAGAVVIMSFALPSLETGAFYSTSLIEPPPAIDHLEIYVPSNPFRSLSGNYVPAVVLFCGLFGIAVMRVRGKETLLAQLDIASQALRRINSYVIKLTPIGVFAISASAAGTLTVEEFVRLQGYFLTFGASVLLLTFWVIPMVVVAFTPFTYREVLGASKDALITGFVTGSVFVVIPLLIEGLSALFEQHVDDWGDAEANPGFVVPIAYSFPDVGKILSLIFIPFAAWFYGSSMALTDFPFVLSTGLLLAFGKLTVAIPFLLNAQQLPSDIFQLFLISGVVAGRFADLAAAMHIVCFTAMISCAVIGKLRLRPARLATLVAGTLILLVIVVGGVRGVLAYSFQDTFRKEQVLAEMHLLRDPAPVRMIDPAAPNPVARKEGESRLERIRRRHVIRIGYQPDRVPFSYVNEAGELVGFDVEIAHRLAADLDVAIEFVPYRIDTLNESFDQDHFDLAISGVIATLDRSETMLVSAPYLIAHMGIIVPDHRKDDFKQMETIRTLGRLRVGVLKESYFRDRPEDYDLDVEVVELESEREFFTNPDLNLDVLLTTAEGGSAWTLIYPHYAFVSPAGRIAAAPMVFPLGGRRDLLFQNYLRHWIRLRQLDGTIDRLFEYWMQGRNPRAKQPRWSILRDVLGWIE